MIPINPKKLQVGDCIGLVSPANPSNTNSEEYNKAKWFLTQKGFRIVPGMSVGKGYRICEKLRAYDLMNMIKDPSIRCIMATAGGGGGDGVGKSSAELLSNIDWDFVKKEVLKDPKIIIGMSDITSLLLAINKKTGLIIFYGPNFCSTFGEAIDEYLEDTYRNFESICMKYDSEIIVRRTSLKWSQISNQIEKIISDKKKIKEYCDGISV